MFFRLLLESFRRQRRRKLLAGLAILLGATAVTAMLALATTIGDRIHKELAVYGANIVVTPISQSLAINLGGTDIHPATANATLHESDITKLKTIFWANNITGISPELAFQTSYTTNAGLERQVNATGFWFHHPFGNGSATTGAAQLHPSWKLTGAWPQNADQVVLGKELAQTAGKHVGDDLWLPLLTSAAVQHAPTPNGLLFHITGIADTASPLDNQILFDLQAAQSLNHTPDAVSRIDISARTKPEDTFARQDPATLSPAQREIWYCRPYANSIAFQIREAIPGADARQLRQVEQTEGKVLSRISGLMALIAAAALLAAGFAVSSAMATAVLERRAEIGLMRSLGASRSAIATLFYAEIAILALLGGTLGYLAGSTLAALLGARIFPADAHPTLLTTFNPVLLPVVVGLAFLVALLGSTPSIRSALREDPSTVLRSNA